jgi:hypothetical protein
MISVDAPPSAYPAVIRRTMASRRPAAPDEVLPGRKRWFWCPLCGLWVIVERSGRGVRLTCGNVCKGLLLGYRLAEARPLCSMPGCEFHRRARWLTCSRTCAVKWRRLKVRQRNADPAHWHTRPCVVCEKLIRRRFQCRLPSTCSRKCTAEFRRWHWLEAVLDVRRKAIQRMTASEAFEAGYRLCRQRMGSQDARARRSARWHKERADAAARRGEPRGGGDRAGAGLDGGQRSGEGAPRGRGQAEQLAQDHRLDRQGGDADAAADRPAGGLPALHAAR